MSFDDEWGSEPTVVEREATWLAADFGRVPELYQAPVAGRFDDNNETRELPAIGGE